MELKLDVNGLYGNVSDPTFLQSIAQLHACGLTSLSLSGNELSGSLTDDWGELSNLAALSLAHNQIEGTIPEALRRLQSLAQLVLDSNLMHGTIPGWLDTMQSLKGLSLAGFRGINPNGQLGLTGTIPNALGNMPQLTALTLASNSLYGTLPPGFCHPQLWILQLANNALTGTFDHFLNCSGVGMLDISRNRFTGTLPSTPWNWKFLALWLDVNSNQFEGTVPEALFKLPLLVGLNLGSNRFSGTMHSAIGRQQNLLMLGLNNNNFTGTIEEGVWYLSSLLTMDLSHNQFTGTISSAVGSSYYLATLLLSDNLLTGILPPELGLLRSLKTVNVQQNLLSCNLQLASSSAFANFVQQSSATQQCTSEGILPCFLNITQQLYPRPDDSHMECPYIIRKTYEQAIQDCKGSDSSHLGEQVSRLADLNYPTEQTWMVDPSYYQFAGCRCLQGYFEVWSQGHTVLSCKVVPAEVPLWVPLVTSLCGAVILLAAATALLLAVKMMAQLKRKWQREAELKKNRLKGMPSGGPATIVVTDVEKYSELMQRDAPLCIKALGIHNNILRKATTTHAGHVVEQEGDSWAVAFHRPVDAVAFCLQVQQALQKSAWPRGLNAEAPGDSSMPPSAMPSTATGKMSLGMSNVAHSEAQTDLQHLHTADAAATVSLPVGARRSPLLLMGVLGKVLQFANNKPRPAVGDKKPDDGRQNNCSVRADAALSPHTEAGADSGETGINGTSTDGCDAQVATNRRRTKDDGSTAGEEPNMPLEQVADAHAPAVSISKGPEVAGACGKASSTGVASTGGSITSRMHSVMFSNMRTQSIVSSKPGKEGQGASKASTTTVRGLKVRMGMATGWVRDNCSITACALFELAKGVSEMANGGQVLAEAATFEGVRNWLTELAIVDHKGYNEQLATSHTQPVQHAANRLRWWLVHLINFGASKAREVLVLDAGEFWSLKARAATWKDGLNLKGGAQQLTRGYLEAPGALPAGFHSGTAMVDVERPLLGPVTMVFAAVHGGKSLVRKKEQAAHVVHNTLQRIMQAVLLALPDGYLCREQEGELKYMLAFQEPTRAAEWCLIMQEVLQHVPWPAAVRELFSARRPRRTTLDKVQEVLASRRSTRQDAVHTTDGRNSTSSCGGLRPGMQKQPLLKMALAQGVPEAISPDVLGRADYFGPGVNLAARMMDVAAHGGQVVLSTELAEAIFK
eukprot:gene5277-5512_t